jgi:type IV pilus assembly protein PilQ
MRQTLVILLTLVVTLVVTPPLWAQDPQAQSAPSSVASVGFVPENNPAPAVNVTTETSGASLGALSSRSTEQVLDRLVNITFVNADLENALRIIAKQMDLNIIIGPGARGRTITLDLRDVPLRFALDAILSANDLGYVVERGGIVRIVPAQMVRPENVERQTLVRRVNWVLAPQVEDILKNFVSSQGTIRSDAQTNSIIVSDVPSKIEEIDNLLNQIDVPERQVMIEARLVNISESALRSLHANFEVGRADSQGLAVPNANSLVDAARGVTSSRDTVGVASGGTAFAPAAGIFTFGDRLFGEFDLSLELEALESEGLARILAAPRVATLNNVPALIDIKREIPYVEAVQGPSSNTTTNEVEFKDEGLSLEVIPTITNNGFVRMEIRAEQLINVGLTSSGVPTIDRRTSRTNVIVEDKSTVALGGLRQLDAINNTDGVPWFHRIPVLGNFFRGDDLTRRRLDFYLFVTPSIIQSTTLEAAERYAHDLLDLEWNVPRDYFFDDTSIETTY